MLYVHQAVCISPQETGLPFARGLERQRLHEPVDNKLTAVEPDYAGIPRHFLRRMGKTVRMGIGASVPLLRSLPEPVTGIIVGTANGGTEDSYRFLKQIIEYDEGLLSPGDFVQSTSNALASQLSLLDNNKGYNLTHVHRGLAFEYALIDALLAVEEKKDAYFLVAGVDEMSSSNFMLDKMEGWYKSEPVRCLDLYGSNSPGAVAGEGAAAFAVSSEKNGALAAIRAVATLHSGDPADVLNRLEEFIRAHTNGGAGIDALISGENGDVRLNSFYTDIENAVEQDAVVLRYKHCCGEYPTAMGFAVWMACQLFSGAELPAHMIKRAGLQGRDQAGTGIPENILLYNTYKGRQHSFIWMQRPGKDL